MLLGEARRCRWLSEFYSILISVPATVCDNHSLEVKFNNGVCKRVDLMPLVEGTVFELLRDPLLFAQVQVDPAVGTVVWLNGANLAPEAVYELPDEREISAKEVKRCCE